MSKKSEKREMVVQREIADACNIFGTLHDLKREHHEIIVSIHLYKILVHLSPNEMLC